jgi:hypothetical protein
MIARYKHTRPWRRRVAAMLNINAAQDSHLKVGIRALYMRVRSYYIHALHALP